MFRSLNKLNFNENGKIRIYFYSFKILYYYFIFFYFYFFFINKFNFILYGKIIILNWFLFIENFMCFTWCNFLNFLFHFFVCFLCFNTILFIYSNYICIIYFLKYFLWLYKLIKRLICKIEIFNIFIKNCTLKIC